MYLVSFGDHDVYNYWYMTIPAFFITEVNLSLLCIRVLMTNYFYFLLHASLKITSARPTNQCSFEEN